MPRKTVGDLLKECRRNKLGISVREAAKLAGVHYTYLSRIENNFSEPSDEVLDKILAKYELSNEEKADLVIALKFTPSFENVVRELGAKKTAEIMYRKSKEKNK